MLHENVACSSGSKAQQTDTISTSLLGRERENENFEIDDLSKKLEAANETTKKVKEEIELKENAVTTMKEMFQDKITKLENEKTAVEERILKLEQATANMIQSISSAPAPKGENYSKKLNPGDKLASTQSPASELHAACSISIGRLWWICTRRTDPCSFYS